MITSEATSVAFDTKYGRVTTEHGKFVLGEPVVVMRARDQFALYALEYYARLCTGNCNQIHVLLVNETAQRFKLWQLENPKLVITPQSATFIQRLAKQASEVNNKLSANKVDHDFDKAAGQAVNPPPCNASVISNDYRSSDRAAFRKALEEIANGSYSIGAVEIARKALCR